MFLPLEVEEGKGREEERRKGRRKRRSGQCTWPKQNFQRNSIEQALRRKSFTKIFHLSAKFREEKKEREEKQTDETTRQEGGRKRKEDLQTAHSE